MAKKSKVEKNKLRRLTVAKHASRRAELKAILKATVFTDPVHIQARRELSAMPRDASRTRFRNRDAIDGRPRAFLRKFGVSRIRMREMAHRGELPGVTKSSW